MKNAWRSWGLPAALIVLLTLVAHLPDLHAGFVWDDGVLITDNPMVKASDGLHRFWFTSEARDYRPLLQSLWWLEWRLWDSRATGYHVVNVLFHAVNVVLVWMILRRLRIPGAWLAAAVFAIHPVNVATVAWVSEQKNTLSMLFYAVAILLYLRFDEEGRPPQTSGRNGLWCGLSLAAGLLALLSKTAVVVLPVVLLGCMWWRHGQVRRRDWLCSLPYFAASLVMALVTIVQHQRGLPEAFVRTGGIPPRLALAGWVPWFYLYKALLPVDLMVIYPKWEVDPACWISYVPGVILLGAFVVFWRERKTWGRPLLFGLGYFVVTLFPVLGFFDQAFYYGSWVADHWQYYSIVGVVALVVAGAERICRGMGKRGLQAGAVAGLVLLTVLTAAAWRRSCVYVDDETLWRDNVARNPDVWPQNHLACALVREGKLNDGIWHFEQALRIDPDLRDIRIRLAAARYNLGVALKQAGKTREEIQQYELALRVWPGFADAHYNLGVALWETGDVQGAIRHWTESLESAPDFADVHYSLGVALEQVGRVPEAIAHYEQALRIQPGMTAAQNKLARLRAAQTGG